MVRITSFNYKRLLNPYILNLGSADPCPWINCEGRGEGREFLKLDRKKDYTSIVTNS